MYSVLDKVFDLLKNPTSGSPLEPEIARQLEVDRAKFERTAREWARKYANKKVVKKQNKQGEQCNQRGAQRKQRQQSEQIKDRNQKERNEIKSTPAVDLLNRLIGNFGSFKPRFMR